MHASHILATTLTVAIAVPVVGIASPPSQPKPPSSAEVHEVQEMMTFRPNPVFRDAKDHVISQATFDAATKAGQRYTAKPDFTLKAIVLTLLPPGVDTPGSIAGNQKNFSLSMSPASPSPRPTANSATAGANIKQTVIPKPGTPFPSFDLPALAGGHLASAHFAGKPYVVDFFFADCVGCIAELPQLNAFHTQYPHVPLVAITFDNAKIAAGFVKQRRFNWPVVYNGMPYDHKLGIKVYPTMVVVGAKGKVLATRVGAQTGTTPASLEHWFTASVHHAPAAAGPV